MAVLKMSGSAESFRSGGAGHAAERVSLKAFIDENEPAVCGVREQRRTAIQHQPTLHDVDSHPRLLWHLFLKTFFSAVGLRLRRLGVGGGSAGSRGNGTADF